MSSIKISQLPYVGNTGYTVNDIIPFVSYINPTGETSETKIEDVKDYILNNSFVQNIIKVGKGGNVQFTSLYDAIQSITGSSNTNRYSVQVGPGIYVEPPINLSNKPYVSIVGSDINTVVITPNNPSNTIFTLGNTGEISFLTISGATSGVGIVCNDLNGFALVHKVSMYDNDVQISVTSSIADTQFYGEYIDLNGNYSYGVYVIAGGGYTAFASLENHYNFPSLPNTIAHFCQGVNSSLNFNSGDCVGISLTGTIAFRMEDSSNLLISNANITGWDIGIEFPNVGGPCTFDIDGISIFNSISYDLKIDNPLTSGTVQGSLSHQYISNVSESVYWAFVDHTDGELDITRKLSVTFKDGTHTDLSTLIFEGGTMGVLEGGEITIVSGLTINIAEGYGYLESIMTDGIIKRYDWGTIIHTLPANSNQYIYINQNGILSNTGTRPNSIYNIVLGRVVTNSTNIIIVDDSPLNANHTSNQFGNLFRNALGPIYSTGSIVTENVTPYHLNVTSGDYYYSTNEYLPSGGSNINFKMYYRDGGSGWSTSATTQVVTGYDNNTGSVTPLSTTAFTKHTLYVVGEGVNEQYFLVLGQNQYTTLVQTENALLPTPPSYFSDSVTQIASIYVQQGQSNILQIEDIRPVIGFKAGGVNASSVHGNLLGLTADDHKQYLLVDGSRGMEGDLNMGGNDIYSAGTVTSSIISATTYQNLPVDPNYYVTAFTYNNNVLTIKQTGQPDLTATINSVTGWTVNGNLTVSGNTSTTGDTSITGTITQKHPTFLGTNTIRFTANNTLIFSHSLIGDYMTVGAGGNTVDFSNQEVITNGGVTFGNFRSGTSYAVKINQLPTTVTAGTQDYRSLWINPTINFGGTYSGNIIGCLYDPTISSIGGGRHIAMQLVSGDVLLNTTTGNTGIGTTNPQSKLHVSGNTRINGNTSIIGTLAIGKTGVTTGNQIDIQSDNGYLVGINVGGQFLTQIPGTGINSAGLDYGVKGFISNDGGGVGIYGYAGDQGGSVSGNFYGGVFISAALGGNNYAAKLQDGTEGKNKFLYSVDDFGSTNWTNNLTGATLTVTGNTTLQSTTASTLNVTGNTTLRATTASTLNVTGNTSAQGLTATTISATTYLNVPSFVNMVFAHSSVGPADATTYYIGALSNLTPSTANRDAWSVNSQYTGNITEVSIISNFGGGSSENSTMTIYNLSAGTSQVITSTLQYVSGTPVQILFESFSAATQPAGWSSVQVAYSTYAGLTGTTSTLTSPTFDGTAYASLNIQTDVAKFGAGTDGPILIEYSLNGGTTWTSAGTTATPTGSTTYLTSTVSVPSVSSTMAIRFSVNPTGTSGKRLKNVYFNGLSSSINNNYVLGTPLAVTSGDKLQIRWTTPTWATNPSGVTNLFNLKLRL